MFFSLCIPTMDRFDTFLKKTLSKYIENEYINEIIITDENGNDIEKIILHFNSPKLKLYKNEYRLGCFLNKHKACSLANNIWIALIDSDNFADINYFKSASDFIENNNLSNNTILSPSKALPSYKFNVGCYRKQNLKGTELMLNTGNYIINKYLISNISFINDIENIKNSNACDVILFNIMLFEQFNINFYVIKDMTYLHTTHNGSIYLQECNEPYYKKLIYELKNKRLINLLNSST
tara:strand:+ start:14086 stop:14796 length:711 start_codon:yes stop_codon:yes gene_type:complete